MEAGEFGVVAVGGAVGGTVGGAVPWRVVLSGRGHCWDTCCVE